MFLAFIQRCPLLIGCFVHAQTVHLGPGYLAVIIATGLYLEVVVNRGSNVVTRTINPSYTNYRA